MLCSIYVNIFNINCSDPLHQLKDISCAIFTARNGIRKRNIYLEVGYVMGKRLFYSLLFNLFM
jgi:hypothetical protein